MDESIASQAHRRRSHLMVRSLTRHQQKNTLIDAAPLPSDASTLHKIESNHVITLKVQHAALQNANCQGPISTSLWINSEGYDLHSIQRAPMSSRGNNHCPP